MAIFQFAFLGLNQRCWENRDASEKWERSGYTPTTWRSKMVPSTNLLYLVGVPSTIFVGNLYSVDDNYLDGDYFKYRSGQSPSR
jgi:hypothetical protein